MTSDASDAVTRLLEDARRLRDGVTKLGERARREAQLLRRRFTLPRVRLVHHPDYVLPHTEIQDPARGARVLQFVDERRWFDAGQAVRPPPLGLDDLLRVHDRAYLESLDEPEALSRVFGGALAPDAARAVLLSQRRATAGTVHAVRSALRYPWIPGPVVNLGGGFHHARRDRGAGFCIFNDVAVAVDRARADGFQGRVLVVDLDLHHGDGTRSLFADDERVTTCSIHAESWDDSPAVASIDVALGPAVGDGTYLAAVRDTLPEAFQRARPDLVIYVAGVDVAAGDALGSWRVSADAIAERDRLVFERARGKPTVMVLAGGYGPDAWRYTARTVVWLATGEDRPVLSQEELDLFRFRRIRGSIHAADLRAEDVPETFGITEADIYGDLVQKKPDRRLLGFYSEYGLELAFERYGLAEHLRKRGYPHFVVKCETTREGSGHTIRVLTDDARRDVLMEVVLSESHDVAGLRLMTIEWMLLQDPRAQAAALLPGQKHKGLGGVGIVVGMLLMASERLGYDGLTLVPAHYHVAQKARRIFAFLEPDDEAYYLALTEATSGLSAYEASRRIADGEVRHRATGEPATWRPGRMVLAATPALRARLEGPAYGRAVEEGARRYDLVLETPPERGPPSTRASSPPSS